MIAVNVLPETQKEIQKEKVVALFYRIIYRIIRRKLLGRMLRSRDLRTPRINRTSSRSKGKGNENPSELRD